MTVCIAAIASSRIITVSDKKLATYELSLDNAAPKLRLLSKDWRWYCLFSAEDASRYESIYYRAAERLTECAQPVSVADVETAITSAYRDELRSMAALTVLRPLTMDLPTFELRGRARLGDAAFSDLLTKIRSLDTRVELLVVGFGEDDVPHIMRTSTLGDIVDSDMVGFDAIGSGANIANGVLFSNPDFRNSNDLGLVTYRLCEAKFAAELSGFVGRETLVMSFGPDGVMSAIAGKRLADARAFWTRRQRTKLPAKLTRRLGHGVDFKEGIYIGDEAVSEAIMSFVAIVDVYKNAHGAIVRQWTTAKMTKERQARAAAHRSAVIAAGDEVREALKEWGDTNVKPANYDEAAKRFTDGVDAMRSLMDEVSA